MNKPVFCFAFIVVGVFISGCLSAENSEVQCLQGDIEGRNCGAIGVDKDCYAPLEDAGRVCSSESDCKGACVVDVNSSGCIKINNSITDLAFGRVLAVCDSSVTGVCSGEKLKDAENDLMEYSSLDDWRKNWLKNYTTSPENKIVREYHLACY